MLFLKNQNVSSGVRRHWMLEIYRN